MTAILQLASRFLSGYGLAECPVENCATSLMSARGGRDAPLRRLKTTSDPQIALDHLSLLSWPSTRHVVFPAGGCCTGFLNNGRNGSDYAN